MSLYGKGVDMLVNVSFPISFPNKCLTVTGSLITERIDLYDKSVNLPIGNFNKSSFTINTDAGFFDSFNTNEMFSWYAIGF